MKFFKKSFLALLTSVFLFSCVSGIERSAEESFKLNPDIRLNNKLALLAMMAAGSSSLNVKTTARVTEAPYSPARIVKGSQISLPGRTSMEGFRYIANDVLAAKFKQMEKDLTIIPPKETQAVINRNDLSVPYLDFLQNYSYLSANKEFLTTLGKALDCRYLLVPQLVVISNVNDSTIYFVWAFGNRGANYTVAILGQIWDLSTGELAWSGRGVSRTGVSVYQSPATFEMMAGEAAEQLIQILP